jgi:YVTN family beta-propeller protein
MTNMLSFWIILAAAAQSDLAVVEKKGAAVGFYNSQGVRVAGVKTLIHPHEMLFSPDKKYLYVTENGLLWMTDPGEGGNSIVIIDVAQRKLAGRIDLGDNRRPHGMDLDPRTGRLVVTVENPSGLLLVDPAARKVIRRYDTKGEKPHMVLLDRKAEYAWVSNSNSGTVAAIHLETGRVDALLKLGENTQGGVITKDGKKIYLCVMGANKIVEIDTAKRAVTGEIATGKGPARLALTPDEKTLVYNIQLEPGFGFADVATRKQLSRGDLPGRPLSLTLSPDGKTAYLGVQEEDQIAVVDVASRKVTRYLKTPKGAGPDPVLPLP